MMMIRNQIVVLFILGLLCGCANEQTADSTADTTPKEETTDESPQNDSVQDDNTASSSPTATTSSAPITDGTASINGENTKITFVGTKTDGSHKGGFLTFQGEIAVDASSSAVTKITLEIQTDSLWSDNEKLTGHLKSADFFNVRKHASAGFASTSIAPQENGGFQVTGDLTLLGVTEPITFSAKANATENSLTLTSEFAIDRTKFGMTYGEGKVDAEVTIKVDVGGGA